jgi:hypothetical protein
MICLPQEYYVSILLIFILITSYYVYKINSNDCKPDLSNVLSDQIKYINDLKINIEPTPSKKIKKQKQTQLDLEDKDKRLYLEKRDKDALYDELKPPEKRVQEYQYPNRYIRNVINIPSRGALDNYHAMGTLVRKEDEKILQLFGRQKFQGSTQWEYYVTGADTYGFPNKMPIKIKGDKEIDDKHHISIDWLNKQKGDFQVNLYDYDIPRYNPYDY